LRVWIALPPSAFLGLLVIGRAALVGLAQAIDHGRASGKNLAEALHHDRIVAGHRPRCAEARRWPQRQRDDRHGIEVLHDLAPAGRGRNIRRADLLQRFHRTAAPGAVDHANQRDLQRVGHLLALHELAVDRGIGSPAAHGEVIGRGDDGPILYIGAAEDQV